MRLAVRMCPLLQSFLVHGNAHRLFLLDEIYERQSLKLQVTQIHGRQRGYERNKSYQIHVRPRRSAEIDSATAPRKRDG